MRNLAALEADRSDPRPDPRGDRTPDRPDEPGPTAGPLDLAFYLDEIAHLPLCRWSGPNPANFFVKPENSMRSRRRWTRQLLPRCPRDGRNRPRPGAGDFSRRFHVRTGARASKVDRLFSSMNLRGHHYNSGPSLESGQTFLPGVLKKRGERHRRRRDPYPLTRQELSASRGVEPRRRRDTPRLARERGCKGGPHITTEARGPKVDPRFFLDRLPPHHFNRGASGESGPLM